jgi:hypothetical protein
MLRYTFKIYRESAEHLVNIAVSVSDRQKLHINFLKSATIDEAFKVGEDIPVFIFPEISSQVQVMHQ